jgi:hypothetical protein
MNSKDKERLCPTGLRKDCLVSNQALSGFFVRSRSLIQKEVVGASGFEPPTSWSRTGKLDNLKPCGCRAYKLHHDKILPSLVHKWSTTENRSSKTRESVGKVTSELSQPEDVDPRMMLEAEKCRTVPHDVALVTTKRTL